MKKTALVMALAIGVTAAFAQDLTSSKGEKYLPEANDWAIGFDAMPVVNMFGHLVSNSGNNTTMISPMGAQTIVGKMFMDDKTAIRAMLGINFGSTTNNVLVHDATSTSPTAMVTDADKHSTSAITLGGGIEKRRGNTRLQGYYGAMLMLGFGNAGSDTYTYGNSLSATNTTPTNSFGQNTANPGAGVLTNKAGGLFALGLDAFIGAEYFIVPKISIGAEYWWGIGFSSVGQGSMTSESWTTSLQSASVNTGGHSSFNVGNSVGNPQAGAAGTPLAGVGNIMINFHF